MEIVVLSGKGGTGKTTVASSLAVVLKNKLIVDADVDAPNLHLVLSPRVVSSDVFIASKKAQIDKTKCIECGLCIEKCRFEAITQNFEVDEAACEGCGVCAYVCPVKAIELVESPTGRWFISQTEWGPMVHALLEPGEENSGKLVSFIKEKAKEIARKEGLETILIDGPPGVGCPVNSALSGADVAIVVVEPTLSGLHDMERVLQLCRFFGVEPLVVINKFDLNREVTDQIAETCKKQGVKVTGKIPFLENIPRILSKGVPPVFESKEFRKTIQQIVPNL